MKIKNCLYFTLVFILFSCDLSKKKESILTEEPKENISEEIDLNKTKSDTSKYIDNKKGVYVDFLNQFYNHNDYYISLYFKEKLNDSLIDNLHYNFSKVIYDDAESSRESLEDKIVKDLFITNDLDKLLVIDEDQNFINYVNRKNYEFYNFSTGSEYIASYSKIETLDPEKSYTVISHNSEQKFQYLKSPKIESDSLYKKELIKYLGFNSKTIHNFASFKNLNDTISIVSIVSPL